jgi:outer membrane PBP1 activator LpoA protein
VRAHAACQVWLALLFALHAGYAVSQEKPTSPPPAISTSSSPTPSTAPAPDKAAPVIDTGSTRKDEVVKEPVRSIAVILPLSSKALGKAAEAVRAGILAAAEVSGKDKFAPRVYLAEDDGASLAGLFRKATTESSAAVIAGITRDGASVVAREAGFLPTLALNTPGENTAANANNFFYISLAIDHDARLAARAAANDGYRSVVVISSSAALPKRAQDAFEREWARLGGTIASRISFSGDLNDGPKLKAAMEKPEAARADFAFIAAEMAVARFARPFLPQGLPVYATAQTFDPRAGAIENLDLDSVKYLEMPWFAERDHLAVMAYPRPTEPMPTDYERLYALGIDAWRIVYALLTAPKPTTPAQKGFAPIDGVTGRIAQDGPQFVRTLTLLEMRDGKPHVIKPSE